MAEKGSILDIVTKFTSTEAHMMTGASWNVISSDLLLKWVDTLTMTMPATHTLADMSVGKQ
jgi:hypothetical protein